VPALSRRRLLAAAGALGTAATAGCVGSLGRTEYAFDTFPAGESLADLTDGFLLADPTAVTAQFAVDYPAAYKRSVVETLLARGTVDVVNWQLGYDRSFGTTTRPEPRFLASDGTYHAVRETGRTTVTDPRWVFFLQLVDGTPDDEADATVVTDPPADLSATDRLVVRRAVEAVGGPGLTRGPVDVSDRPLGGRGPTFHHAMDPEASALVPDPPFDYLRLGDRYFAARAERGPVERTRYTFGVERVADARPALESHVATDVVDADFDAGDLAPAARDVLSTATDVAEGRIYTESAPMSPGLTTVTDRAGMTEYVPDDPGSYAALNGAVVRFAGVWYRASLSVRGSLL
jgi:hypothetical protein